MADELDVARPRGGANESIEVGPARRIEPTVEGRAPGSGGTLFAADQADDRVMREAATFVPLRPVGGLDAAPSTAPPIPVTPPTPAAPRGTAPLAGLDGQAQRRVGGFARPPGAWPLADGSVVVAGEGGGGAGAGPLGPHRPRFRHRAPVLGLELLAERDRVGPGRPAAFPLLSGALD